MRVGFGFDVHAFKKGDYLMLAGVKIPYTKSFDAHSDGDVILHALIDAILGAAKEGDIGTLFPDNDPEYKNIDSRFLLREAYKKVLAKGWEIGNIDITVILEQPKILPYREIMEKTISSDLMIDVADVSLKATTTEKLGFTGRGEGVAAQAIVLLKKSSHT